MEKNGKLYLGPGYHDKVERLRIMTGQSKQSAAIRVLIDGVLYDADQKGIVELPPLAIGIKPIRKPRRKATTGA